MFAYLLARFHGHNDPGQKFLQVGNDRFCPHPWLPRLVVAVLLVAAPSAGLAQQDPGDVALYRAWIQEMKEAPRGPFARIRWFCNDGTVLPPKAYACAPHDGGHQHGEWSEKTSKLRSNGYFIANILAGSEPDALIAQEGFESEFASLILEQFLISVDDGWIFREAQYYRGALQVEDEHAAAENLLRGLLSRENWLSQRYLPLREGTRLLAHGEETASLTEVRQLSATLADKDPGFKPLRNKIHGKPEAADAERVREYSAAAGHSDQGAEFDRLAELIDEVFGTQPVALTLAAFADSLPESLPLTGELKDAAAALTDSTDTLAQIQTIGSAMVAIREQLSSLPEPALRLTALDLSIALEIEHFALAAEGRESIATLDRGSQLGYLATSLDSLYGAGLLSQREYRAQLEGLGRLETDSVPLSKYKGELDYLGRTPGWGAHRMEFYFSEPMARFREIEPLIDLYIQDRLRGSALLGYAVVLDTLSQDANRLAGVTHQFLEQTIGTGFRALNPGIARGVLRLPSSQEDPDFDPEGIYVLPETTAELPPIAGILTAGEGNPLSHVQLLARNLGIPNVAIAPSLLDEVRALEGQEVVLAVSPGGSVQLVENSSRWDEVFGADAAKELLIKPDLEKLDLEVRDLIPLEALRAGDSGRIVGPKAAKLGELKHLYPEAVAEGLAVPFGVFRALLDEPAPDGSGTVFDWMVASYDSLESFPSGSEEWSTLR